MSRIRYVNIYHLDDSVEQHIVREDKGEHLGITSIGYQIALKEKTILIHPERVKRIEIMEGEEQ